MDFIIVLIGVPAFFLMVGGVLLSVFGSSKPPRNGTGSYRPPFDDADDESDEDEDDGPSFEPRHVDEFMNDPGGYWQEYPNRSGAISAMLDDTLNGGEDDS
jgi:hypothetical protein